MYVGLDLHKHYMQVAVQDEDGNLIMETQIKNTQDHRALQGFLERLDPDAEIAMESSSVDSWTNSGFSSISIIQLLYYFDFLVIPLTVT